MITWKSVVILPKSLRCVVFRRKNNVSLSFAKPQRYWTDRAKNWINENSAKYLSKPTNYFLQNLWKHKFLQAFRVHFVPKSPLGMVRSFHWIFWFWKNKKKCNFWKDEAHGAFKNGNHVIFFTFSELSVKRSNTTDSSKSCGGSF